MNSRTLPFLVFGVFVHFPFSCCEVFTSTAHISELIPQERLLKDSLLSYIHEEGGRLARMKYFLERLEFDFSRRRMNISTLHERTQRVQNPIDAILQIKRFVRGWNQVVYEVKSKAVTEEKYFRSRRGMNISHNASRADVVGAARGLLRLQTLYNLNVESLTTRTTSLGGDYNHVTPMTARDHFDIGRIAYYNKDTEHIKVWMYEALRVNEQLEKTNKDLKLSALDHIGYSEYKKGNHSRALEVFEKISVLDPTYHTERINKNIRHLLDAINSSKLSKTTITGSNDTITSNTNRTFVDEEREHEKRVYEELCRGTGTKAQTKKLKCEYLRTHPLTYLKPVAMEIMHGDPRIVVFHNVLSERQIKNIKKLAVSKLQRATVNNIDTGVQEMVNYRISKSAWIGDEEEDEVKKISQKIEAITGLSTSTAEDLQIANYGLGGFYDFHLDYAKNMSTSAVGRLGTGNRVATVLFYLNDVEAGGATVFGHLGVRAVPKKGSAVFWYNLHKSGEGDPLTMHAGCPVLVGSKWVANKWFHEIGQEFRRPCGLRPDE